MRIPFRTDWRDFPCRLWSGSLNRGGYGVDNRRGVSSPIVHRRAWIDAVGPIPPGLQCMHACDVRACYAIEHLGLGTQADNNRDKAVKGRVKGTKLTVSDVIDIKTLLALPSAPTLHQIGSMYGVSYVTVHGVKSGKNWAHVSVGCEV